MAVILNTSINLTEIPKEAIISGKKGKYVNLTVTVNDELDKFGNQGPVTLSQTKEQRENKEPRKFLGNVKVAWTNGQINKLDGNTVPNKPVSQPEESDLPF